MKLPRKTPAVTPSRGKGFSREAANGYNPAMRTLAAILAGALVSCGPPRAPEPPRPTPPPLPPPRTSPAGWNLQDQVSGTTQRLQAVSALNPKVAWASGTGGTFAVTDDGGLSWRSGVVAGADSLEFRDVQAIDSRTAYLLSSGNGTQSRIYKTVDGGRNWQIQFINRDSSAFYDCFAFWDARNGIAWSDGAGGRFPYLRTMDGGANWELRHVDGATEGEGAFAASGTCVITRGNKEVFVATGAGKQARIFSSPDRGATWRFVTTPMVQGTSTTGHTSIGFRNSRIGIAVGGDVDNYDGWTDNVILTTDGGQVWTKGGKPTFSGPVFGAVYVPGAQGTVVAVGPKGVSWSPDDGASWQPVDTLGYWSAAFVGRSAGWLVGPGGRITKVSF